MQIKLFAIWNGESIPQESLEEEVPDDTTDDELMAMAVEWGIDQSGLEKNEITINGPDY